MMTLYLTQSCLSLASNFRSLFNMLVLRAPCGQASLLLLHFRFVSLASAWNITVRRKIILIGALLPLMLATLPAQAATNYVFPGKLPSACTGSNGVYSCSALSLGNQDTITIASPKPATITINGDFTTNQNQINSGGTASDLILKVTGTFNPGSSTFLNANVTAGSVNGSGGVIFGGNISATNNVSLGDSNKVTGSIISTNGSVSIGNGVSGVVTVGGDIAAYRDVVLSQNNRVSGSVTSSRGGVNIGNGVSGVVTVGGDISAYSDVLLSQNNGVSGSITSSHGDITLNNNVTVSGIDGIHAGGTAKISYGSKVCGNAVANALVIDSQGDTGGGVGGNISANSTASIGDKGKVGGSISASTVTTENETKIGNDISAWYVKVGYGSQVGGNITAFTGSIEGHVKVGGYVLGFITIDSSSKTNVSGLTMTPVCSTSPPSGGSTTAGAFECLENGANTPWDKAARKPLYTKLAGTAFSFDIAALKTDGTLESNYVAAGSSSKYVRVELFDDTTPPASCTNYANPIAAQTVTFAAGTTGRAATGNFSIGSAYKQLRCRVKECTDSTCGSFTAVVASCSSDQFSVRPSGFAPATTSNATNIGASGTPRFKAGRDPFAITATANASGYTGSPKIDNSLIKALDPATWEATTTTDWVAGAVAGSFTAAISGATSSVSTGAGFTYSEAGAFQLSANGVYDDSWTAVDSDSTKNDCISGSFSNVKDSSGKYGCLFGTTGATKFGRFIPDHFTLLDNSATVTNTEVTSACGGTAGFTYMDQPLNKILFSIEARSMGNAKTQNYQGVFAYATVAMAAENGDNGTDLSSRITLPAAPAWTTGTYTVNTTAATFIRLVTPDGPYDSLQMGARVTDPDGSALEGTNMNSATAGLCGAGCDSRRIGDILTGAVLTPQTTRVRFGRLKLSNAHGSERLNLPIPMRAEYWNITSFVTNTADNCTMINNSNVVLSNPRGGIKTDASPDPKTVNMSAANVVAGAGTFARGIGSLKLLKPSPAPASKGSIDVCVDLGTDNPEVCKTNPSTPANLPWLQGKWSGTAYDDDPRSRATFGVFKNANEFIYIREMY